MPLKARVSKEGLVLDGGERRSRGTGAKDEYWKGVDYAGAFCELGLRRWRDGVLLCQVRFVAYREENDC